jgi:hypothetical protein
MTLASTASAQVRYRVTVQKPPAEFKSMESLIEAHLIEAAEQWTKQIESKPCTIDINFVIKSWPNRGFGHSLASVDLPGEEFEGHKVVAQGWAAEMQTGEDPNGDQPDVEVGLDPNYMRGLWWDPNPTARTGRVPKDKTDAMSVVLHELGHALVFNGFRDPKTGELSDGKPASTYDRFVSSKNGNFWFNGPLAMKNFRGIVPLAQLNNTYHHVCSEPKGRQAELQHDLMNGFALRYGKRYVVSTLDLAVAEDCGIKMKEKPGKRTAP